MYIILIRTVPQRNLFGTESFMPLGIAYLAAALGKEGHKVRIIDLLTEPFTDNELLNCLKNEEPDIVGFSSVTATVKSAYRIARLIKENTRIKTAIGGPHASALPEEPLFNNFDFVIRGEGEATIVDLCKNLDNPFLVKGISFVFDGKMVHNPDRDYIKDIGSIPFPARQLFPEIGLYKGQPALGNRLPVGNILTSRGCPYNCNFCCKPVFGRCFRKRTAENIFEEWNILIKDFKVKEIAIIDETFTFDTKRVVEFCELLLKDKLRIPWSCPNGIRVDNATYDLLSLMRKAGCYRVAFGVESGSQKILDSIGKKITIEEIVNAFRSAKKAGIQTMAFFMLGNVEETEETMEETIRFAKTISSTYAQFLITIPYPGSYIYEEIKRNGRLFITDWDEYGGYEGTVCFEYKEINKDLVRRMYKKAYREYYLRFGYLLNQITNLTNYKFLLRRIAAFSNFVIKNK